MGPWRSVMQMSLWMFCILIFFIHVEILYSLGCHCICNDTGGGWKNQSYVADGSSPGKRGNEKEWSWNGYAANAHLMSIWSVYFSGYAALVKTFTIGGGVFKVLELFKVNCVCICIGLLGHECSLWHYALTLPKKYGACHLYVYSKSKSWFV